MGNISKQVDKLFAEWDRDDSPGCALGVISKGRFIHKRCYGMADLEHGIPLTPDSVFDVASTSKQFTAACVALLARRGKLSLDDRIQKHLPEIPEYDHPVTIRHLIHHTSGLRDYLTLMYMAGMPYTNKYPDADIYSLIARQKRLNFRPGSDHMYCNTGYFLLAEIVKRVSGLTLRRYAAKNIFSRLGMASTHFHDDYSDIVKNRACGYKKEKKEHKGSVSILDVVGDGGLYTTLNDLARWDRNYYDNRVGGYGQDLIRELTTTGKLNNGEELAYAYGLFVEKYRGLNVVHHGGAWVGYRLELIRFPEQQFSVICLANTEALNAIAMARKVADLYLAKEFPVLPGKPQAAKKIRAAGKPGYYFDSKTEDLIKLSARTGCSLELSGRTHKLNPVSAHHFEAENGACRVHFTGPKALRLTLKSGKESRYSWLPPSKERLSRTAGHAGEYFCPELDAGLKIFVKDKALHLLFKCETKPLKMTQVKKDLFKAGPEVTVYMNKPGQNKFTLTTGRVKGLVFTKK